MKSLIPLSILALAVLGISLLISSSASAKDDGATIAQNATLPGKHNADGRGSDFAPELYKRLTAAGGEAYLITFKWRHEFESAELDRSGAMVVFRDEKGRYWGMDLTAEQPLVMPSKEPLKCLHRMYPALLTTLLEAKTDPKLEGQYADLSRTSKSTATTTPSNPTNNAPRVVDSIFPSRVPR